MKCPYCDREMLSGYLHNPNQPLQWLPEDARPALSTFAVAEDAVRLPGKLKFSGYRAAAHHCPGCKIVIAKTE